MIFGIYLLQASCLYRFLLNNNQYLQLDCSKLSHTPHRKSDEEEITEAAGWNSCVLHRFLRLQVHVVGVYRELSDAAVLTV